MVLHPIYDEGKDASNAKTRFDLREFFGTKKYEYGTTAVIVLNGDHFMIVFPLVWHMPRHVPRNVPKHGHSIGPMHAYV